MHNRQKSLVQERVQASPASGSAQNSLKPRGNKSVNLVKEVSAFEQPYDFSGQIKDEQDEDTDNLYTNRIYQGALSSASRLSQIPGGQDKFNNADDDMVGGIEMMAPTAAYKTAAAEKSKNGDQLICTPPTKQKRRRLKAVDVNEDEDVRKEELLMMDLVGIGGDTGGNQQSSSAFDELDFTKMTADDLLTQVLE